MLEEVQEGYEKGFRAFKVRMDWRDYRQDSDPAKDLAIFQRCREWLPDDVPLSFDANCGYSVPTAIEQGRRFEELGIAHFEEPLPHYDLPGLRQVADALDCAVSSGEGETSSWRFRDLIQIGNPDILQPDVIIVGGLSEMLRVFELAVLHNKIIMPHSPNVGANSAASLHAYSTISNAVRPHEFSEEFTGPAACGRRDLSGTHHPGGRGDPDSGPPRAGPGTGPRRPAQGRGRVGLVHALRGAAAARAATGVTRWLG